VQISDGTASPDASKLPVGDDCSCDLVLDDHALYTSWADGRTGQRQVWFARYRYAPDAAPAPSTRRANPVRSRAAAPSRSLAATGAPRVLAGLALLVVLASVAVHRARRRALDM
jgi:hypothetical protein